MSLIKLRSSEGVIFTVDAATVKQIVTIQTMIDHEDEDSEEVHGKLLKMLQITWKIIEDATNNFHDPTIVTLLQKYEVEHGYDVIVTLFDYKHLKCFDTKVR